MLTVFGIPEEREVTESYNVVLIVAACLSAVAAVLHIVIMVGGPAWYRLFGAGERLATAAESGRWYPAVVTAAIALALGVWAVYALSGAGVVRPLPFLKIALVLITAVYILRGIVVLPLLVFARAKATAFLLWSSLICLGFGAAHLLGLIQIWPYLA